MKELKNIKVAIMQPYVFPYIGYFQLVNAVDEFVFYDDVNFIKRGWINRNRILVKNESQYFTFPCKAVSQNVKINHTQLSLDSREKQKILKKIEFSYKKASEFDSVFPIIESVIKKDCNTIAELAIESVERVSEYLGLDTSFHISSASFANTEIYDRADRLISITKMLNSNEYINAAGGVEIYDKSYFLSQGVTLSFLKGTLPTYRQYEGVFVSTLSIIDVMMFNTVDRIQEYLNDYELE